MTLTDVKELVAFLKDNKEAITPIITDTVEALKVVLEAVEPGAKNLFIKYMAEWAGEKREAYMANGFTREEAIYLLARDSENLKKAMDNIQSKK